MGTPALRQFIIAAVAQGCREMTAHGEIVGWKGSAKARHLVRPKATGELIQILPNIRDSDTLSPTVLANLARTLEIVGFDTGLTDDSA